MISPSAPSNYDLNQWWHLLPYCFGLLIQKRRETSCCVLFMRGENKRVQNFATRDVELSPKKELISLAPILIENVMPG
jgi:hypothetical protein